MCKKDARAREAAIAHTGMMLKTHPHSNESAHSGNKNAK